MAGDHFRQRKGADEDCSDCTLWNNVPSHGSSDGERALLYLTDELVRRGHEVTLFASADSRTNARLQVLCSTPCCRAPENWSRAGAAILAVEQVFGTAFQWPSAVQPRRSRPYTTGSICRSMFRCSNNFETSRLLPRLILCQQTIYPGVPAELYRFNPRPGKYLAFIGSLSMGKGLGMAIEIARRAHLPLRVASRQNSIDGLPLSIPSKLLVAGNGVDWLGELTEPQKISFLGGALALVCTQGGPDASSLCIAEALACGTPVVAFRGGQAAEMIYDHVTGFACDSFDEMVYALPLVRDIDRKACRNVFEKRFSVERMTDQYIYLYERLIASAASRFSASIA
jgi:glycosyltransferase involved in cell wall biosynthesis